MHTYLIIIIIAIANVGLEGTLVAGVRINM